jgi:pimeloyl-ACP methyl ester carboxylesterase
VTRRAAGGLPAALGAAWAVRHLTARAVRRWRAGAGEYRHAGPLTVRTAGSGRTVVVLLHGLPASGDTFGAAYDRLATAAQLVVPDLLGFARSQDLSRTDFSLQAHLKALDDMLASLELDDCRLVVGGHSMGGVLALHWAARHATQVDAVVALSAPLFTSSGDARRRLNAMVPGLAWIGMPGPVSRAVCTQLCTRRPRLASWLYVLTSPRLPVALSRQLSAHTWTSYLPVMQEIVLNHDGWQQSLLTLHSAGVPVVYASGVRDALAPPDDVRRRARTQMTVRRHPTADHFLPLEFADWCVRLLEEQTDRAG